MSSREGPGKHIEVRGRKFHVEGLGASDPYYASITADFEPDFLSLCGRMIGSDYVCLDVGANIGLKSLALSQFAPEGRVIAIEAAPSIIPLLQRNIRRSGVANIDSRHVAISDHDGTVAFTENSAFGHLSLGEGVSVPSQTLRTLVIDYGLERVDFIKIDVEGFEWSILRGSWNEIARWRSLVLFEFNSWCQLAFSETSPVDFARWILGAFSHVFMVRRGAAPGEDLLRLSAHDALRLVHTNLILDGCVSDILATNDPARLPPALR